MGIRRQEAWTFIGIERNAKLVLAYEVGKRNTESARRFMEKLRAATSEDQRFQLTTDGFKPYGCAVGMEIGDRDYAQLVKIYQDPTTEQAA